MGGGRECPPDCSAAEGGKGWGCSRVSATSDRERGVGRWERIGHEDDVSEDDRKRSSADC